MLHKRSLFFIFLFFLPAVDIAYAGTLSGNSWSPSNCSAAPAAEQLDLSSNDAYNLSVEKVNNYRKKVPVYLDCLVQEANADIQSITQSVKSLQQTTRDAAKQAEEKVQADIKAADKKFGK